MTASAEITADPPRRARYLAAALAGASILLASLAMGQARLSPRQLIKNLKAKTFTGERIDLDLNGATLNEIVARFAALSGLRFEISPAVLAHPQARMQYTFKGSPWDNALASILNGQGLDLRLEGDVLQVVAYQPETDRTAPAFLIGSVSAAALLGGVLLILSRRKRRRRKAERQRRIALEPDAVEEIVQRLSYLFQVEKIYRSERLSLDSLAERLGIQPYQLSAIVNHRLGKSFTDMVADFRVEDVKKSLLDPRRTANILHIAYEAGFATKASFNRVFKERTGLTPSEFKRKSGVSA
jgi:AraC-like DNA-binding protein